jgi:hypothetical protein
LLKTNNFEVCDSSGALSGVPGQYAILSHTWSQKGDELIYEDLLPQRLKASKKRKQFRKLKYLSEQAERDSLHFIWMDSCCIDKRNSAELTEAINSMYSWYSTAQVCYVYLSDVRKGRGDEEFRRSRWFTRAWTLQELLAPSEVRFYDSEWDYLGSLSDPHYTRMVSDITGIDENMLRHKKRLSDFSVAERMSWAAHRQATRVEDRAYSLLGIFDANMPMLYGEGQKAFIRLQEEIIKTSTDHSVFCWDYAETTSSPRSTGGRRELLAPSPSCFTGFGSFIARDDSLPRPYQMTNRGLEITLPIRSYLEHNMGEKLTYARLNCACRECPDQMVVLNLQKQYDLDAAKRDIFKPWLSFAKRKRQEAWDILLGKDFDWQFVASHARRGYAVGHSSHGGRVGLTSDSEDMFREQTIAILRELPVDNSGKYLGASGSANPVSAFHIWNWLVRTTIYAAVYIPTVIAFVLAAAVGGHY